MELLLTAEIRSHLNFIKNNLKCNSEKALNTQWPQQFILSMSKKFQSICGLCSFSLLDNNMLNAVWYPVSNSILRRHDMCRRQCVFHQCMREKRAWRNGVVSLKKNHCRHCNVTNRSGGFDSIALLAIKLKYESNNLIFQMCTGLLQWHFP